jgi:hypothetical protein
VTKLRTTLLVVLCLLPCSFSSAFADGATAFFDDSAVREIRLYFSDSGWYNTLYKSHASDATDPYFPARFVYGATSIDKIGARFKGNSSFQRNGIKKSFKLDFHEYDSSARFLGMKKLQPSFMREKMFLDFAGKYIAAMRAVHVRLYVNDAYYGLYIAIEQPDKPMMQFRYGETEDGNLYEAGESVSATLEYLGSTASSYTSYDAALGQNVASPLSLGAETDSVYLVIYGTGIRGATSLSKVSVQVGGQKAAVQHAAAQGTYPGFDQVNVGPLPRSLAGAGSVEVVMTVDDNRANRVTLTIQ